MSGPNDGRPPTPPPTAVPCRARIELALLEDGNVAVQAEGQAIEIAYLLLLGQHLWANQHLQQKGREQQAKQRIIVPTPLGRVPQ